MFEGPPAARRDPADVLIPPAVNISANASDWRGQALSNFCLSPFVLDGALYASIEGFIQGIKFPEGDPVRAAAFQASGWDAKRLGDGARRDAVHWQGARIAYGSPEHHRLIERAIRARVSQSTGLRQALASTAGAAIAHETGAPGVARHLAARDGVLPHPGDTARGHPGGHAARGGLKPAYHR